MEPYGACNRIFTVVDGLATQPGCGGNRAIARPRLEALSFSCVGDRARCCPPSGGRADICPPSIGFNQRACLSAQNAERASMGLMVRSWRDLDVLQGALDIFRN